MSDKSQATRVSGAVSDPPAPSDTPVPDIALTNS